MLGILYKIIETEAVLIPCPSVDQSNSRNISIDFCEIF
jgi:hypothetical protein